MYAETSTYYLTAAIRQVEGFIGSFLEVYEQDKLYVKLSQYNVDRAIQGKQACWEQEKCATQFLSCLLNTKALIAVREECFEFYPAKRLDCVHDYYFMKATDDNSCILMLEK